MMANPTDVRAAQRTVSVSELELAKVRVTGDQRLLVEFKIDDLIRKLVPGGVALGHCGGCNGCMGCSM
jgi:hypothetical protein